MERFGKTVFAAQAALFLSGAAALIYQSLWLRSFGLIFGNTTIAASLALAVFMGGLALGGHLSRKWTFRNALKAYAILELLMALFAIGGRFLLTQLPYLYGSFLGGTLPGWFEFTLKLALTSVVTLPTAVCAGMTLPVITECLKRRRRAAPDIFPALYGANTLGAAFGTLACAYFLIPNLGISFTYLLAVLANILIGAAAWMFSSEPELGTVPPAPNAPATPAQRDPRLPWLAFGAGLSAFLLEVVWVRSLILVLGSSAYSFSNMLFSVLLGIALGAWLYGRRANRLTNEHNTLGRGYLLLGFLVLVSYWFIGMLPGAYLHAIKVLPYTFGTFQVVGFLLCFFSLLLVTIPQGFLFPALLRLRTGNEPVGQEGIGELYLWNTLGALTGSLAAGLFLIPFVGFRAVYLLAAFTAAGIGLCLFLPSWGKKERSLSLGFGLLAVILTVSLYRPWDPLIMTLGVFDKGMDRDKLTQAPSLEQYALQTSGRLLSYAEGRETIVTVRRLPDNHTILSNNGKLEAGDGEDLSTQKLSAHIPLACFPKAQKVFLIGWGSGSTAGTLSLYPVKDIHCVEIEPQAFEASNWFKGINYDVQKDPRFSIHFKDARNDLLASRDLYDLIISEPSNLWAPGVSNLFTSEFYDLALSHLEKDGVFAQWFPYFSVDLNDVKTQVRTFCKAFPNTQVWVIPDLRKRFAALTGSFLLIGSRGELRPDYATIEALFRDARVSTDLKMIGVDGPWPLLAMQWIDHKEMLEFAGEGPLNTDAFPRLEYSGPKSHYRTRLQENQSILEIFSKIFPVHHGTFPQLFGSPLEDPKLTKKKKADLLGMLAMNYARLGRFGDSLNVTREIQSLGLDSFEIIYLRGKDLIFSGQDIEAGIREMQKAQKMRPNDKNILTNLSLFLIKTGKSAEAFVMFQKGAKKWPTDPGFVFGEGLAKFYEGDLSASAAFMGEVLRANPKHGWASVVMNSIRAGAKTSPQSDGFLNLSLQP